MTTIDALSKKYGDKQVLNRVNLNIANNTIQGLVGSNGAGKTTLFNCLYKLCNFEGDIRYPANINIGYMPTDVFFYDNMKGIEFLEFALVARKVKVLKSEIKNLNILFDLPLDKYVSHYSTGMQKRLVIMSILLQKNDLYLLDEPFNGLDLTSVILVKKLILKLKECGRTVLISSHIITSLSDVCDSIAYLNNGSIHKIYTPEEYSLIEKDVLRTGVKDHLQMIDDLDL